MKKTLKQEIEHLKNKIKKLEENIPRVITYINDPDPAHRGLNEHSRQQSREQAIRGGWIWRDDWGNS